jgi:hypothetical protein
MSGPDVPRNTLLVGDVRQRLAELADGSVDTVITSPPYFQLRNYQMAGQIGLEDDVTQWVEELRGVGRELARVLTPSGSWWLNVADSFSKRDRSGAPPKSLLLGSRTLGAGVARRRMDREGSSLLAEEQCDAGQRSGPAGLQLGVRLPPRTVAHLHLRPRCDPRTASLEELRRSGDQDQRSELPAGRGRSAELGRATCFREQLGARSPESSGPGLKKGLMDRLRPALAVAPFASYPPFPSGRGLGRLVMFLIFRSS